MSKMSVAIIESLNDAGWLSPAEIAKRAGFPYKSVSASLAALVRSGSVMRKDDPGCRCSVLFKRGPVSAGFGVSGNISEFDRLIKTVRAA